MIQKKIPLPLLGAVAVTRGMLGAGAALLFLDKVKGQRRRIIGWGLFLTGALSTIPLAYRILRK